MVRDDFAGPGGLDEGMRLLGLTDVVGVEWDRWACETAHAAGHRRVRADVRTVDPGPWDVDGYVASPPCTSFSAAGKGAGRAVLPQIVAAARAVAGGADVPDDVGGDETTALILQPVRQVRDLRPRWVALEQVPSCLPIWQEYARLFRQCGYSASCAVLCAADFGVPQTRRRAILVARLDGPALLPEPTHDEHPGDGLFGSVEPWVSMATALGWGFEEMPGRTMCGARSPRWLYQDDDGTHGRVLDRRTNSRGPKGTIVPTVGVPVDRPAPSFTGKSGTQWVVRTENRSEVGGKHVEYDRSVDRPAPTVVSNADRWELRPGDALPVLNPGATSTQPNRRRYAADEPAPVVAFGHDAASWAWERPAITIVGSFPPDVVAAPGWRGPGDGPRQNTPNSIRITPQEAAILQSFPPDYPWQGPKTAVFGCIGNAVPPVLAAAVVGALLGLDWQSAVNRRAAA